MGTFLDAETKQEKDRLLYVQFQKNKDKRKNEIEVNKFEMKRNFQKYTLFVKNYPETFTADSFEQIFGPYGGI